MLLQSIQGVEQGVQIRFVRFLRGCETCLVHPVVDRMVHPLIHGINLRAQMFRIKPSPRVIRLSKLLGQQRIKLLKKHANDLTTLITHNRLFFLIPQRRHQIFPFVIRIGFPVQLAQIGEAIQGILGRGAVTPREQPAFFSEGEVAEDELNDGFEAFEGTDQVRAVRPGAAEVDVQCITVLFRRELGTRGVGDEGAKLTWFSTELAIGVGVVVDWGLCTLC